MGPRGPSTRVIAKIFFTIVGLAALLYVLYLVRSTVGLLFIALFLAIALGPAVDFFHRRGLPRAPSILLVYVLIGLGIVGVGLLVVPPVVSQVDELAGDIPGYLKDLRENDAFRDYDNRYDITDKLNEQAASLPQRLGDAAGALRAVTVGVFSAAVQLVTVLTIVFFLLLDGKRISAFLLRSMGPGREERWRKVGGEVYRAVGGYVAGAVTLAVMNGVFTYVVLLLLGVPFAVPLAVLMAFLGLIPLVGASIGGAIILLVTLFNDFPADTIVWAFYILAYQQLENNVFQPFIYKRTVNVPPLAVITGILMGASLLGVLGALVAIPIAATVQIILKDFWDRRQARMMALSPTAAQLGPEDGPEPPPAPA